jgi:DNA-directed RNA polymerase specialized sigma24 family protein
MSLPIRDSLARRRALPCDEEILLGRAELLARPDRDLLLAVWVHRGSAQLMAHLAGCHVQTIRRRVRKLLKRIQGDSFLAAARALPLLPARQGQIARLHFCQGASLRQTATACGLSLHEVRRHVHEIRGAMAGIDAVRRDARAS